METAQLIIQALILLGIIYVAFIQERVTKVKDRLWETIKDYPDIAERRFSWKEEEIKKEAEQKVKEVTAKLESEIEKGEKSFLVTVDWLSEFSSLLARIFVIFGFRDSKNFFGFRLAIQGTEKKKIKETLNDMLDIAQDKVEELKKAESKLGMK